MMKISNTILALFQLRNHMSAKADHKLIANLDYIFYVCDCGLQIQNIDMIILFACLVG